MTRVRRSRTKGSAKHLGKSVKTKRYRKDTDQVYEEIQRQKDGLTRTSSLPTTVQEPDAEDLPGMGDFLCVACSRHFISSEALAGHEKTKAHRKRLKELESTPYSQKEADQAAGLGVENKRVTRSANLPQEVAMQ